MSAFLWRLACTVIFIFVFTAMRYFIGFEGTVTVGFSLMMASAIVDHRPVPA